MFLEHLCRRCTQIQRAVKNNPTSPDYDHLESIMRHANATRVSAYMPDFDRDLAETQRLEGLQLKNARLHREEVETERTKLQAPKNPKNKGKKGGAAAADDGE